VINYEHLHSSVSIARSGGVIRAAERLNLTPQTLSGQLSQFEERARTPTGWSGDPPTRHGAGRSPRATGYGDALCRSNWSRIMDI